MNRISYTYKYNNIKFSCLNLFTFIMIILVTADNIWLKGVLVVLSIPYLLNDNIVNIIASNKSALPPLSNKIRLNSSIAGNAGVAITFLATFTIGGNAIIHCGLDFGGIYESFTIITPPAVEHIRYSPINSEVFKPIVERIPDIPTIE